MDYKAWEREAAELFARDRMWELQVYRRALYLNDLAVPELLSMARIPGMRKSAGQAIASIVSIRANISEGYGRFSALERARFHEIALGSARESRDWYLGCRTQLPPPVVRTRLDQLGEIVAMLTGLVKSQRKKGRRR